MTITSKLTCVVVVPGARFSRAIARRQKPKAQQNHSKAKAEGKTCIDCHKGIAHLLPKEYKEDDE